MVLNKIIFLSFVCLLISHDISKTAAARITKLDIEMFHHESWKPIYFGVKRVKGQCHKAQKPSLCWFSDRTQYCHLLSTLPVLVMTLVWVLASS